MVYIIQQNYRKTILKLQQPPQYNIWTTRKRFINPLGQKSACDPIYKYPANRNNHGITEMCLVEKLSLTNAINSLCNHTCIHVYYYKFPVSLIIQHPNIGQITFVVYNKIVYFLIYRHTHTMVMQIFTIAECAPTHPAYSDSQRQSCQNLL